jgi:hemerythrin-like domain-containing protein
MGLFTSSNPVIYMLEKDHDKVRNLLKQFDEASDARMKAQLVRETLLELEVHTRLEEGVIYPAIRPEIDQDEIMDEAVEEHHVAHVLINELKRMTPGQERYYAKFAVLGENIKHHIREEEHQMFPKAEKIDMDWEALAKKATEQKEALIARFLGGRGGKSKKVRGRSPQLRRKPRARAG